MAHSRHQIERIYIVPTRHGLAFLGIIIVMILVASGSGNNLIYGLAFILFAIFFLAMIATHRNLKALQVEWLGCEDGFVDEIAKLRLLIVNSAARPRYLIRAKTRKFSVVDGTELREVAAQGSLSIDVPLMVAKRGEYPVPAVQVGTIYPLGLFHAWTVLKFDAHIFIYPKRQGQLRLLPQSFGDGSGEKQGAWAETQHEDFREHTRYREGESQHHVDWKAFARRGEMLTKRYEATSPKHFILDWQAVARLGKEPALSQLSAWVANLQSGQNSFEMRLPGTQSGKGRGWQHGRACLRALARYPEEES